MRRPMMSGHCNFPQTANPTKSHELCASHGAGNRANPAGEYQPCPCACHFVGPRLECECGGTLVEAPHWPEDPDYPGEPVYTHIDVRSGMALGEECPT